MLSQRTSDKTPWVAVEFRSNDTSIESFDWTSMLYVVGTMFLLQVSLSLHFHVVVSALQSLAGDCLQHSE